MLPVEVAQTVAARLAAVVIRQEARAGSFMDLCLNETDRAQVAEELRRLAAALDGLSSPNRPGRLTGSTSE